MEDPTKQSIARGISDGEKEQVKLTASYINGIAIGLALVGGLTIPSSMALNATSQFDRIVAAVLSLCSLAASPYIHHIHLHARRWMLRLDR